MNTEGLTKRFALSVLDVQWSRVIPIGAATGSVLYGLPLANLRVGAD